MGTWIVCNLEKMHVKKLRCHSVHSSCYYSTCNSKKICANLFFTFCGDCFNFFLNFIYCVFVCSSRWDLSSLCQFLISAVCFMAQCSPFPISNLEFVLLACSVGHLSFLLFLDHHTSLQLLHQSQLLLSLFCAILFRVHDCLLQLLGFSLPFLLHNSLGT